MCSIGFGNLKIIRRENLASAASRNRDTVNGSFLTPGESDAFAQLDFEGARFQRARFYKYVSGIGKYHA
jgi:hypothetical protein